VGSGGRPTALLSELHGNMLPRLYAGIEIAAGETGNFRDLREEAAAQDGLRLLVVQVLQLSWIFREASEMAASVGGYQGIPACCGRYGIADVVPALEPRVRIDPEFQDIRDVEAALSEIHYSARV